MNYDNLPPDFWNLLDAVCDDTLDERQAVDLESRLLSDAKARELYVDFLALDAELQWLSSSQQEGEAVLEKIIEADDRPVAAPIVNIHDEANPGVGDYFSQGVLYSYMVGGVLTALLLLIAAVIPVSSSIQTAKNSSPSTPSFAGTKTDRDCIGRITGMFDCRWEGSGPRVQGLVINKSQVPNPQFLVSLGDKFALSSGLLEITYDTGAKVLLQGPVTYEVASRDGGFLAFGKLTARLEKKGTGVRSQGSEDANLPSPNGRGAGGEGGLHQNTDSDRNQLHPALTQRERGPDSNPQSLIPNPSLSTIHSPLFTIKTPTAVVTDLGTEFGVEVDKQRCTTSHVFRGSVRIQAVSLNGETQGEAQVLRENQSARVENVQGNLQFAQNPAVEPARFIRGIPSQTLKILDLVDVVAGGNGFLGRRNAGINPTNGRPSRDPPPINKYHMNGDGRYHQVKTLPLVDGVFIPVGGKEPVQIDSAGHVFDNFPVTDNQTSGYVWGGGVIPAEPPLFFLPATLDGVDYSSADHGVLGMHANKGITFDLAAIRRTNPGYRPVRFLAVAGNATDTLVGIWVFVDGKKRFQRREFNQYLGAAPISIALDKKDRFLTLATTDNGGGFGGAWALFGDPRLELKPVSSDHESNEKP